MNPHRVTQDFESALCEYTGAPYAVAVNSCTAALLLAVAYFIQKEKRDFQSAYHVQFREVKFRTHLPLEKKTIEIPKRTYISVPMSIIHAGGCPTFRDEDWIGHYQLKPLPIWDSAREFTTDMYRAANLCTPAAMVCVSFHASKTLGLEQGGAILHDNPEADAWLRRARFDGRQPGIAPKDDTFNQIGWHCYMNPSTAAQGILRLHSLPRHNAPLPNDDYPELSKMEIFQ